MADKKWRFPYLREKKGNSSNRIRKTVTAKQIQTIKSIDITNKVCYSWQG